MKTIIVGAGITGIAAALFAKKIGLIMFIFMRKQILLVEFLKIFTLIMKLFLRNCQYLDAKSPIFDVIDKKHF